MGFLFPMHGTVRIAIGLQVTKREEKGLCSPLRRTNKGNGEERSLYWLEEFHFFKRKGSSQGGGFVPLKSTSSFFYETLLEEKGVH
jgi:hypothetical protein